MKIMVESIRSRDCNSTLKRRVSNRKWTGPTGGIRRGARRSNVLERKTERLEAYMAPSAT